MRLTPSVVLLRTQSDERLTLLAREGSEPAFTALVERYRRTVLRACGRVLSEARAEDATQQTFIAAWKALERGDEVREVRPWLLRIARNTALNALRSPGYEYVELAESISASPDRSAPQAELERREVVHQTLAGLAALPENQREALLRNAVEGAPHADIARDLGISEGATRQLVLRARATLRAGATALTPLPILQWAAAGGGAAGSAFVAKAAAVAVVGGTAVATPVVVTRQDEKPPARAAQRQPAEVRRADAGTARRAPALAPGPAATTDPATTSPAARPAAPPPGRRQQAVATAAPERAESEKGDESGRGRGRGRGRGGGESGSALEPVPEIVGDEDEVDDDADDDSGRRGPDSDDPGSDSSGSGPSGSGHSGSDDDDAEDAEEPEITPEPTAVATPDDDDADDSGSNSGPGSGGDDPDDDERERSGVTSAGRAVSTLTDDHS